MNDVVNDILAWSQEKLPNWQQFVLTLILSDESISIQKIQEIKTLCLEEKDEQTSSVTSPQLPNFVAKNISLKELSDVVGVNTLAPEQKIRFSKTGLTIFYGDNGTGKTGYSRIIKIVVRARDRKEAILSDYKLDTEVKQSANIVYVEGDVEKEYLWSSDSEPPIELSNVSFFDSKCAHQYVESKNNVAYRPYGLDILDRLVQVVDLVKIEINKDIQQLNATLIQPDSFHVDTEVGKLIVLMKSDSSVTWEKVETLATLSQDEETEFATLNEVVKKSSDEEIQKEQTKITNYINRIQRIFDAIKKSRIELNSDKVEKLLRAKNKIIIIQKALEKAANEAFNTSLPSTGGDEWRELWKSAKKYSEVVYPNHTYPVTESNAQCLLCQQPIVDEAVKQRLHNFEEFVKNDLSSSLDQTRSTFARLKMEFDSTKVPNEDWELLKVEIDDSSLVESVTSFLEYLVRYQQLVNNSLNTDSDVLVVDHLDQAEKLLTKLIADGRSKLAEYANASKDAERKKLIVRYNELNDKKSLSTKLDDVKKYFLLCQQLVKLTTCHQHINTHLISRKSTDLTARLVTKQLADSFQSEMDKLGVKSVGVNLEQTNSEKGNAYFRIELVNSQNGNASLAKIASEGEYRAVALAGFLTELATADHTSSIVLDDPVTSLDHGRRELIATRLIEESKNRQVVIFTHEVTFLMQLMEEAKSQKVPLQCQWLRRDAAVTGLANDGPPWMATDTKGRIGTLADKLNTIKKNSTDVEHEIRVMSFYSLLRQAWERAVEDTLLKDVVKRFGREVNTKNLRYLKAIDDNDINTIEASMTKCSKIGAHDRAPGEMVSIPEVTEIEADLQQLIDWVANLKTKQKPFD